ncbi:UDP-glucose 4-epimerase [Erwinia toletana]|uniref:UDP-glucose 4-epimerase n=1 Tax=Winslowiella toletana TaxID=92490 RepID=A0ABS4P474_9GAMM|nr:NAD(P)-dependent oxidoreductase [Winslowiella toletana]MBP2167446.1 UDP-glucose 4-epimerase [Winslowiella toletana]
MKVLITGASGFIGGKLLDAAIAAWGDGNVVAFSSQKNTKCTSIVYQRELVDFGLSAPDITLLETIETILHIGAFIPKNGGEANAISACNENIFFTEQLLKLPFNNLKKVVFTSTVDVYSAEPKISELTPTQPATLYGWSKLYCEQLVSIFAAQKGISSQILRVGHVYGPGEEKFAKFMPKTIKSIVNGGGVELYGDGSELRSFIYIDDVIKAILASVNLDENAGVINLVGGHAVSIKEVLDKLILLSGRSVEVIAKDFNGVKRDLVFDNEKLKKYLLPAETDFTTGLSTEFAYFENLK